MSNHFDHGYALLIGVGRTAEPEYSLPVTVKRRSHSYAFKSNRLSVHLCVFVPWWFQSQFFNH
ncbi:MAG: hypothetical protein C4323_21040 [Mastigocladus sp. ERB_26_2]